jgi:hypothetical protein
MRFEKVILNYHAPKDIPDGYVLVPKNLLENAVDSLGSFVSNQGWSQEDLDTYDSLSAVLISMALSKKGKR